MYDVLVNTGEDKSLLERLEDLRARFAAVGDQIEQTIHAPEKGAIIEAQANRNVTMFEDTIEKIMDSIKVSVRVDFYN